MNHSFQWKSKFNSLEILFNIISVMMYSKTGCPLTIQCTSAESLLKQQKTGYRTYVWGNIENIFICSWTSAELLKCMLLYQINDAKGVLLSWLSFVKSCVPFILLLQSDNIKIHTGVLIWFQKHSRSTSRALLQHRWITIQPAPSWAWDYELIQNLSEYIYI